MSKLSRRQLITAGVVTAAGASGLAVAAKVARRYGLVPPDSGGIYGLYDASERKHKAIRAAFESERGVVIIPMPVLSEIDYLLRKKLGIRAELDFIDGRLDASAIDVPPGPFGIPCPSEGPGNGLAEATQLRALAAQSGFALP